MTDDDPFAIPDFLRLTPKQRRAAWKRNPPKTMQFAPAPRAGSPETQAAIDAAKVAKRRRENARLRNLSYKKPPGPVDYSKMSWNSMRNRFEPDRFAHMRNAHAAGIETKTVEVGYTRSKASGRVIKSIDDLGVKVSAHCGSDDAKLEQFARANGVWIPLYATLPNRGLRRMSIVNRLRNRIKRENFKVVWK